MDKVVGVPVRLSDTGFGLFVGSVVVGMGVVDTISSVEMDTLGDVVGDLVRRLRTTRLGFFVGGIVGTIEPSSTVVSSVELGNLDELVDEGVCRRRGKTLGCLTFLVVVISPVVSDPFVSFVEASLSSVMSFPFEEDPDIGLLHPVKSPPSFIFNQSLPLLTVGFIIFRVALFILFAKLLNTFPQRLVLAFAFIFALIFDLAFTFPLIFAFAFTFAFTFTFALSFDRTPDVLDLVFVFTFAFILDIIFDLNPDTLDLAFAISFDFKPDIFDLTLDFILSFILLIAISFKRFAAISFIFLIAICFNARVPPDFTMAATFSPVFAIRINRLRRFRERLLFAVETIYLLASLPVGLFFPKSYT